MATRIHFHVILLFSDANAFRLILNYLKDLVTNLTTSTHYTMIAEYFGLAVSRLIAAQNTGSHTSDERLMHGP